VERFVEKPNLDRAVSYVNSGDYRWNSGMFIWSFVTLTQALETHQPELAALCRKWFDAAASPAKLKRALARDYPKLKKISVDYALMEHAQNVVMADGDFGWDDLGNWTALARHVKADREGNCALAEFVHVDSARNIVVDARTRHRTLITAVGLRDTVVVIADDVTLVADKKSVSGIKQLISKLSDHKRFKKLI
jgi:mannose-1-phosphate guanylyltransferase